MALGTLPKAGAAVLALGVGAGLTFVLVDPSVATAPPIAQAWVDQPLDGAVLPEDVVAVTVHATDPDGVTEVVLSIDGEEILTEEHDGSDELVTVETRWDPPAPGTYELTVVGTDGGGHDGEPGTATFTVGTPSAPTTTTTTTPGDTTTTTATDETTTTVDGATTTTGGTGTTAPPGTTTTRPPTTTTPPCTPATPSPRTPAPAETFDFFGGESIKFSWNYAGCGPERFQVQISTDPSQWSATPDNYFRQLNVVGSTRRDVFWVPPESCGVQTPYYWRMRAVDDGGSSSWTSTRLFKVEAC